MSDELKPCAHCGHSAELMCPSGLSWWVQCANKACGMATKIAYSAEHAVAPWNNRAALAKREADDAEHVAWLRYDDHNGMRPTTLHLCDSDAPGAFKVFRTAKREAVAVPEGFVLVPVEPTKEMMMALGHQWISGTAYKTYKGLLAASQQAAKGEGT